MGRGIIMNWWIYHLLTEIQYHNFNDFHLSQDIVTKITNSYSNVTNTTNSNVITQTPIKSTSTQSLPFFDPSFFVQCKAFENFFLPSDTLLALPILLQAQKDDTVLSNVYKWLKQKQRPQPLTPVIKANFFYTCTINNPNTYIMIQTHISFNITHLIFESLIYQNSTFY